MYVCVFSQLYLASCIQIVSCSTVSLSIFVQFFLELMYILCHYHLFLPSFSPFQVSIFIQFFLLYSKYLYLNSYSFCCTFLCIPSIYIYTVILFAVHSLPLSPLPSVHSKISIFLRRTWDRGDQESLHVLLCSQFTQESRLFRGSEGRT